MICPVDEQGRCSLHKKIHFGHALQLALEDSPYAESIRRQWDRAARIPPRRKGPGLVRRAINYGKAVIRYRRNHGYQLPLVDSEPRLQLCYACDMYDPELDRCLHRTCGCVIKEKVTWSTEKCPKGKWLPVFGPAPKPLEKSKALSDNAGRRRNGVQCRQSPAPGEPRSPPSSIAASVRSP